MPAVEHAATEAVQAPIALRCEYRTNPLGIDVETPRFSWQLSSSQRGVTQTAYHVLVATSMELLATHTGDMWDSGRVESDQSTQVVYQGKPLQSGTRYYWQVRWWQGVHVSPFSEPAYFEMGLMTQEDWRGIWIQGDVEPDVAPHLRKDFLLQRQPVRARLYVCGLGYHEMYINGVRVGDHVLCPAWTDYDAREMRNLRYPFTDRTSKRILYETYDVKELLTSGKNTIGAWLGNGWYNQRERKAEGDLWYGPPKLIAQLQVSYDDGECETVYTDDNWWYAPSPIIANNIFIGEVYDARLEKAGWSRPDYVMDQTWRPVKIVARPLGVLRTQGNPPDRVIRRLSAQQVTQPAPGVYIFDFGENITGWAMLTVQGPRGTEVTLRFAEEIGADGILDFSSTGGLNQIQRDVYILKGDGVEHYEPRFCWHGFRYVELTGYPGEPTHDTLSAKVVHADVESCGTFSCSNPLYNQLLDVYRRSQLGNLHGGVPSDCPHRERLGYTGDGHLTAEAAIFNFDMAAFYTKWLADIFDAQNASTGFVPHTAPFYGGGGGHGWGAACVIIPWYLYTYYGDRRILEQYYPHMAAWAEYMASCTDADGIIVREEPGSWNLGDWNTPTKIALSTALVNTFFYYHTLDLMAQVSAVLGKDSEALRYRTQAQKVAEGFNKRFLDPGNGIYADGLQGSNVFPLWADIVPAIYKPHVLENLLTHLICRNATHFDTGIFGTPLLVDLLTRHGYEHIAHALMNQKTCPSYGFMLEQGATTLWESWRGRGSHNHPMFGSVCAWFYKTLAGIACDAARPGFAHTRIRPHIACLDFAEAQVHTLRGNIAVSWRKHPGRFDMRIEIPVNSSAEIWFPYPAEQIACIEEQDEVVWCHGFRPSPAGISHGEEVDNRVVLHVGSGVYEFRCHLEPGI